MNDPRIPTIDPASFAFRELIGQDQWISFTPVRTGWTDNGTPTVTGRYHKVGKLIHCVVEVTPGTDCATTSGTSYMEPPISNCGGGAGAMGLKPNAPTGFVWCDPDTGYAYLPTQAATANTFAIQWWQEVRK